MSASVEIIGLENLIARWRGAPKIVQEEMSDALDTAFSRVIPHLATYPPETGGSYVRTYKLRRGWTQTDRKFVVRGGEISARLTNPVGYVKWVQGDEQAKVHQGRWQTVTQIVGATRMEVMDVIGSRIVEVAARLAAG